MHFSTLVALLSATSALAAPLEVFERAAPACSTAEKFTNGAFNGTGKEWYLTRESGTGTVTGGVENKYFPTFWPSNGGPQGYGLNFTIPAKQSKTIRLEQRIVSNITDGGNYQMSFNLIVLGTNTTSCTAIYYAGSDSAFPTLLSMPKPAATPSQPSYANWYVMPNGIPGNNYQGTYNIAGAEFSCTAGATTGNVAIYLDNASLVQQC